MNMNELAQIQNAWNVAFVLDVIFVAFALISLILRIAPKLGYWEDWDLSDKLIMVSSVIRLHLKLLNRRIDLHSYPQSHYLVFKFGVSILTLISCALINQCFGCSFTSYEPS